MQVEVRRDSFAAVGRCVLAGGEQMRLDPQMVRMYSAGVTVRPPETPKADRPSFRELMRSGMPTAPKPEFGVIAEASENGGWLDLTPPWPGDVFELGIDSDRAYFVNQRNWLGRSDQVSMRRGWRPDADAPIDPNYKVGLVPGMPVYGSGTVVLGAFGGGEIVDLAPDQGLVVESSYVVAYDLNTRCAMHGPTSELDDGPLPHRAFTEFTGPGRLVLQARSERSMAAWVRSVVLPSPA